MTPITPGAPACPVCGTTLNIPRTGRRPRYCSTSCRQAAHRAKQRAQAAAQQAADARAGIGPDLDRALAALQQARALLTSPLQAADHAQAAGGEAWQAAPPTGWETDIQALALAAARYARLAADHLQAHRRAAIEHAQALTVAGIPPTPTSGGRDDETPARNVAAPPAAAAATKPTTSRRAWHAAPITRRHADGTECTHTISPSGKPRPGQDCPGPARYTATCQADGCTWTCSAGIRAIVEDAKRLHLHTANP